MIQEFPNGKLWMSDEPLGTLASEAAWSQDPVHSVIALAAIVLLIIFMRDYFIIWTPVMRCLFRAKANIEMEHSIQLARTRNRAALLMLLPIWLIADRFCLLSGQMWISLAILLGYLALKRLVAEFVLPRKLPAETRLAVRRALYTYGIALAFVMMVTVGLWLLIRWDPAAMSWVFGIEAGVILLLSMAREEEILSATYHPLVSFLYLCALEILPAACLVAAAVLAD
ncbi:MAG: hypothetical protein IKS71_01320 [Bacteroidales bacterium]|nr:hypothetical protein [Bacteroidales bacterium]